MESVTERMAESEAILRLRPDTVPWREIEGEFVALDQDAATYLAGNQTATLLWRALSEGTTRAKLVSAVTEKYDVDAARAGVDVDAFLEELRSRNLLSE
jgi:coenzyme PQQ synthesis protein D (PqqD)